MKIRTGFVSNSSSSSFVCCVCGSEASGMDMCLGDIDMVECTNGHIFCQDHLDTPSIQEIQDGEDWRYEILPKFCPVCSFNTIPAHVLIRYLLLKLEMSQAYAEDEIKEEFSNLDNFNQQMKKLEV